MCSIPSEAGDASGLASGTICLYEDPSMPSNGLGGVLESNPGTNDNPHLDAEKTWKSGCPMKEDRD
jgi:hypothetical protein